MTWHAHDAIKDSFYELYSQSYGLYFQKYINEQEGQKSHLSLIYTL